MLCLAMISHQTEASYFGSERGLLTFSQIICQVVAKSVM